LTDFLAQGDPFGWDQYIEKGAFIGFHVIVSRIADQIDEVGAGMPFPSLGFDEDYIETPSTAKHGFIVPVTKEAIS
jgi:hypothetical protein